MLSDTWTGRRALLFYAWLLGFTAGNVVNRCSPGWCAMIGFPFTWHAWTDSILTFDDPLWNGLFSYFDTIRQTVGAVLNLLTFVAIASVLTRVRIRGRSA